MKKHCWLVKQTKKGWRVYFCLGNKEYPIKGLLITEDVIESYLQFSNVVYVHLKGGK